ncbi:MAG: beta-lactamase family protein [Flavobacteriales bacterium]|nr:beta-lactamase family protein [Flavobacteriales bacterium]
MPIGDHSMRAPWSLLLALGMTVWSGCTTRSDERTVDLRPTTDLDGPAGVIDAYFTALTSMNKFNGVVLVKEGDGLVLYKAYNLDPDTGSSLRVDRESQFDIHSVSKLFARYQLHEMEQNGELDPATSLAEYLPEFPRAREITIAMLMQHRSGLPREMSQLPEKAVDLDVVSILEVAAKEKLVFEPGTDEQYSNIGYAILYYLIGRKEDRGYSQALIDDVLVPLGMKASGAHFDTDHKNIHRLARNHELKDSVFVQVPNIKDEELRLARVYSTAMDLQRFLDHLRSGGSGILLADSGGVIQQSGGSDGIRAHVHLDLNTNRSYVLLCNMDAIPFMETLRDMKRMLNGEAVEPPRALHREAKAVPLEILNTYAGTYAFRDMDALQLKVEVLGAGLVVLQDGERIAELQAENDSVFFAEPDEAESFEFKRSDEGGYYLLMGWRGVKLKGVAVSTAGRDPR